MKHTSRNVVSRGEQIEEEASHRQKQRTRRNGDSELLDMTRHNKFRWLVGKVQITLPKRPDALYATKRCARKLANHKAAVEKNLESPIKWLYTTSTWSFRMEPDSNTWSTFNRWTGTNRAGCRETRERVHLVD